MDTEKNELENRKEDLIASALKGVCGALPIVGSSIAEIIGYLIPNQRIDRIASLLKALEAKIAPEEKAKVEARMLKEKSIDLMEDGFLQAARALSEERIEHIASLLKNSLTDENLEQSAYKRLLFLLGEISDVEVIILKFCSMSGTDYQEFWENHKEVLHAPAQYLGAPQEEIDKYTIYVSYRTNLERLSLLKRGEAPEFDLKKGMMKSSGYDLTDLGRLLLNVSLKKVYKLEKHG